MEPFEFSTPNFRYHLPQPLPHGPQRLIIDTDAAIDDAVAILLYLFAEMLGLVKIEAFTVGPGRTNQTNVQTFLMRMLEAADRTDVSFI